MRRALLAGALLALVHTAPARAGGLTYLDPGAQSIARAGAIVAAVDDATAVFINPARMVLGTPYDVTAGLTLLDLRQRFERQADTAPYATVQNGGPLGLLPFAAARASFGLDDWSFGVGLHAPNAYGRRSFPVDGAQRYQLVETDLQILYVSAGVAWAPLPELSVGLTLHLVTVPRMRISMVVDGYWLDSTDPSAGPYDALTEIDVNDPARFTATLGLSWRPLPCLEFAVSSRLLPVDIDATGRLKPEFLGSAISTLYDTGQLVLTDDGAHLRVTLPPALRVGARYVFGAPADPMGDIELDLVYEAWSLYERIDISFDGAFDMASAENDLAIHPLDLPRRYRDTFSVRVGGGVRPGLRWLRLYAGLFYESAAAEAETAAVDATTGHRLGAGVGVAFRVGPIEATVAYLHVFELPVEATESDVFQQRPLHACQRPYDDTASCGATGGPTGPTVGRGRYEANASLASFGLRGTW